MSIVRAKEPFAFTDSTGTPRVVNPGQLFDSADPCVVKRPNLFEAVEVAAARNTAATETATAAPGEVRQRVRARKADGE
ncbi:hypothetical protein [Mycolicibacterium sp.]|uniref:hypothetical protein n=1 Tax=Mycolicibacterium sp. TaxID=2320850 RepID=UPI0025E1179A|nr:hypothetical protein [Mycolicibacterium sp.]